MYSLHSLTLLSATFSAALLFAPQKAPAAPGDLDTSFGTGGKVTTVFSPNGNDTPIAVRVQPDGKILVAGGVNPNPGVMGDFGLVRYLPDGSLDKDFGTAGKVVTDFGGGDDPLKMILQPDGRIVLAGYSYHSSQPQKNGPALARYLPNGQLDPSFGTGGKVITVGKGIDSANDGVLQPDGTLLVAGFVMKNLLQQSVVFRYTAGGVMDGTFGTGGFAATEGVNFGNASKIALQGTDRFIVVGNIKIGGADDIGLFRFDTAGHLDTTFGNGGKVDINSGSTLANPAGIVVSSDRKILVAGYNYSFPQSKTFLLRFLPDGAPDNTFGTGGMVLISPPDVHNEVCWGIVLQPDGDIFLATSASDLSGFRLMRCHPDGSLDAGFGTGGRVFTPGNSEDTCLALQSDGKIVVAGLIQQSSFIHFQVSRYEGTPVLTPLESWRQKWFGVSTNTGNAADGFDYDGDGLANLIEWATGLNPTSREASPIAAALNGTSLSLTYPLSDAALNAGTTVSVEWTDDLSDSWHSDGIVTSILSDDGTLGKMKAVLPAGTSGRRFLRLKASHP